MTHSRRQFLTGGAYTTVLAPFFAIDRALATSAPDLGQNSDQAREKAAQSHTDLMNYPQMNMHGDEEIAMLLYPGMTMLDLVGPQYFFASMMGANVHLVSGDDSLAPVLGDTGFAICPTIGMNACPSVLDVLFIPGGLSGTVNAMNDERTIEFVADRGSRARFVTSVCTGSLVLGQAGLLEGKRATSHWAARHLLPEFGATVVKSRLVSDGNVVTGAGVSAGLDFGLAMLAELRSDVYARVTQLIAEYAPEPIFNAGSPENIEPDLRDPVHGIFATSILEMKQAAKHRRRGPD
ncbi:MAG: DJ-1/PfpI family protein [Chromatiales bacterium]|nr:DJ-1/PfpI family protein [Chromatiales bacterium]MYC52186.1 DJ-1/PfpI family protein [Gammaproteobacteria bacterium]